MPASAAWRRLRAIVPLTLVALAATSVAAAPGANAAGQLSAGAGSQAAQHATRLPPVSFRANHAANVAIAHIGDPYRYGAAGPSSFDCSGLTMFSYAHARLHLPRTAAGQYAGVRHILKQNLMRGDLVFFHDSGGHVYHAAIFLYWNTHHVAVIVHAPHTGTTVRRSPVWTSSWYAGTRRPMH
jgi:cell wall-associated NlpC family hydrolase